MEQLFPQKAISYIAFVQVIPFLLFPWSFSLASFVFILVLIGVSAFLGWSLWMHKSWGRKLTIFTQGFNIIIRLITFFPNVYRPERGVNWGLLVTYLLSAVMSWFILSFIDKPEIQLIFESGEKSRVRSL